MNTLGRTPTGRDHSRTESRIAYERPQPACKRWFAGVAAVLIFLWFSGAATAADQDKNKAPLPGWMGEVSSVKVAPSLGAVSESLPIAVPPGRRNVDPKLTLEYNSMMGFGNLGLGWSLPIGQVEKWPGDGTPTVGDPDQYLYSLAGAGGQLVNTGDGVYRAKFESVYRAFTKIPDADGDGVFDGWVTNNGEGVIHRFGGTPDSRIDGQLWMLDLVKDPSGNTITYSYTRIDNTLYPKEIRYTGYAPTDDPGANRVEFDYENRPDSRISYGEGVRAELTQRLHSVSVYAGDNLVRRYVIEYYQSTVNGQSLLSRIYLVGDDGVSSITLRRYDYTSRAVGWNGNGSDVTLPVNFADKDGKDTGARVADVNGDGYADLLDNGQHVYLGDGHGNFTENAMWSASLASASIHFVITSGDYKGGDNGVRLVDVNSDGLPDLFIARPERREIWLNTGTGWAQDPEWTANLQSLKANATIDPRYLAAPTLTADDIVNLSDLAGKLKQHSDPVSLFLWDGFSTPTRALLNNYPATTGPTVLRNALVVELNKVIQGDSIYDADRFSSVTLSERTQALLAQNPSGIWLERLNRLLLEDAYPNDFANSYPSPNYTQQYDGETFSLVENQSDWKGVILADVNGDGRLDILWSMDRSDFLYWHADRIPIRLRAVFLNTGSGWVNSPILTQALFDFLFVKDSQVQGYDVIDVNGDGFADIVHTFGDDPLEVYLGTGQGWTKDDSYTASLQANGIVSVNGDHKGQGLVPTDFDGDGLMDYLQANETTRRALRNTGHGWVESPALTANLQSLGIDFNTSDGDATGVNLVDIDGDGLPDIIKAKEGEQAHLWLTSSMRANLLADATSATGEVTDLQWKNSTEFDNRRTDGVQGLPNPMPLAAVLTRHDGRGNAYTTTYQYIGGLYESKQYRGFRECVQSLPSGLTVHTTYHQEDGLSGQMALQETMDSNGMVRKRETSVYAIDNATPQVQQIRLVQSDHEFIDPGGTRHSRAIYQDDDRLNIVSVQRDPDVNIDGDESTTQLEYVRNDAAGIWSVPWHIETLGPDGSKMKETVILFDGMPEGDAQKALPSETRDWVSGDAYVSRSMQYDQYGNMVWVKDGDGNVSQFAYDSNTSTFRVRSVDPEGRTKSCEYDPRFGSLLHDVEVGGQTVTQQYDVFGRLVKVIVPGDENSPFGTETYTYSPLGDPTSQFYRIQETETPGQPETLDTTSYFDAMGMVYRVERNAADGRKTITLTEFDDAGNVIATSRPFFPGDQPLVTLIERDELHRPVRVEEPDGLALTFTQAGPRADLVDRNGHKTSYLRNGDGKITEVHQWVDGKEQVTHYHYDQLGRLTDLVDALGEETHLAFDGLGRRVELDDPSAGSYSYQYDGEGRLIAQTGPDGKTTHFQYNGDGNLIRKLFPDGTSQEFDYAPPDAAPNQAGRLVHIRDAAGTVDLTYDARGDIIERDRTVLGHTFVMGYAYDSLGRIRRITYPDGFETNYEYDSGGNLLRVTDGDGRVVANGMKYTASGQLSTIQYGNGAATAFDYDDLLRMTSIYTLMGDGTTLQNLNYEYDPVGNVLSIDDKAHGASQTFQYDELNRLTKALGPYGEEDYQYDAIGDLLRKGNLQFTVDPNIPQRVIGAVNLDPTLSGNSKAAPPGNATENPNTAGNFNIEYDTRGNIIQKGNRHFEYDTENQLVRVRDATGHVIEENVYDASGQRVIQRTPQGTTLFIDKIYEVGPTHVSRLIRDGAMLLASSVVPRATVRLIDQVPVRPIGVKAGIGRTTSGLIAFGILLALGLVGWSLRKDAWGRRTVKGLLDLGGAAGRKPWTAIFTLLVALALINNLAPCPVFGANALHPQAQAQAQSHAEKRYYYHMFHLGSVNAVTDDNGDIVAWRNYKPYGETFDSTGAKSGPRELHLTFNGQRKDDSTGLYYFGARHYDAQLGRFLTADTMVSDPLNPKTLNRYAYAGDNPIRYQDPSGHAWWDWVIGIFVAVALVVIGVIIIVATAGAATPIVIAGLTFGLAFVGAGVFAAVALAVGLSPLSSGFWLAVAAGFVLGAAVGAAISCLPAALGFADVGWFTALAANVVVGLAFGAIQRTAAYFASGGGPDGLLADLFSPKALISAAIGVGITIVTFGLGKWIGSYFSSEAGAEASTLAKFGKYLLKGFRALISLSWQIGGVVFAGFTGQTVGQAVMSGVEWLGKTVAVGTAQLGFVLLVYLMEFTKEGSGSGSASQSDSSFLATMPLAP